MLTQGDVDPVTHLSGYGEVDFLGAAQTANSNESNSFNLRARHLYLTVDNDFFGAHLLAGQTWSLATMNTKGIVPRKEDIPLTIDAQYVPGFVWQRTPQIRLVKDFDYNISAAISAENPATTICRHRAYTLRRRIHHNWGERRLCVEHPRRLRYDFPQHHCPWRIAVQ